MSRSVPICNWSYVIAHVRLSARGHAESNAYAFWSCVLGSDVEACRMLIRIELCGVCDASA